MQQKIHGDTRKKKDGLVQVMIMLFIKKWEFNPEDMKDVPPYGMYLAAGGWDEKCDGHNYSNRLVPTIVHHEASIKQEWKVDKKAYDEKIITGYQCACGKTK